MLTKVQKWGNSLALRLPKTFTTDLHIDNGMEVEIKMQEGRIIIVPISKPTINLDDLLEQVTPENTHAEVDSGKVVGNEIW